MDIQEALDHVGGYKPYHIICMIVLGFTSFMNYATQCYGITFIGWQPDYHCSIPSNQLSNESIPHKNGVPSQCLKYINITLDNRTEDCTDGYHFYDDGFSTIVTEFTLVCNVDFLVDASQIVFVVGGTAIGILASWISDAYGRKRLHFTAFILSSLTGSCVSLAPNYLSFLALRTVAGALSVATHIPGIALMLELFGPKSRLLPGAGMEFTWVACFLTPCILGYFITNWRVLQMVMSLVPVPLVIFWFFIDESPQWLLAKHRHKEAEEVIKRMAKYNRIANYEDLSLDLCKTSFPDKDAMNNQEGKTEKSTKVPTKELFFDGKLRLHLLICMLMIFTSEIQYSGITFASSAFGPERFLNYFYLAIIEFPAIVFSWAVVHRWGRRIPLILMYIGTSIPLATIGFLPQETEGTYLLLVLVVAAKFGITCSFCVMYLYMQELFPTTIRNTSTAWIYLGAGIGNIVAPIAAYKARRVLWLPNMIFAGISILAGLSVIPLPETANKPLPLTTDDLHTIFYKKETII